MNALNGVFPSSALILCWWRIRRSVFTRVKASFSSRRTSRRRQAGKDATEEREQTSTKTVEEFMKDWDKIAFAQSVAIYREKWQEMQHRCRRETALINYIQNMWLPLKEHCVSSWIDEHLYLGTTEPSRVEGFHAVLKQLLSVSSLLYTDYYTS
jgi:hypothetical protein